MSNFNKPIFLLLVTILAISSLMIVNSAFAQSIPKPSVPEFSVKQVDRSYDVPLKYTTTTDPFTGKQVTTSSGGYHVKNMTIDVIITNQQFTPFNFNNGTIIQLYYTVRAKGHFSDWDTWSSSSGYYFRQVVASTSDYTVITLIRGSENDILMDHANVHIPDGGQEDFQVSAQAGYLVPNYGGHILPQPLWYDFISFGESSWSNTQTITIPATSSSSTSSTPTPTMPNYGPTSSPTPTPTVPEFPSWTIPLLVSMMLATAGLLVYHKKHKQNLVKKV